MRETDFEQNKEPTRRVMCRECGWEITFAYQRWIHQLPAGARYSGPQIYGTLLGAWTLLTATHAAVPRQ